MAFVHISRRKWVELTMQASQYRWWHARFVERIKWLQTRHVRERAQARKQVAQHQ